MNRVLVSVIIPVHNCAGYIGKAIDSVYVQGVSNEIILVDDASSDNLMEVLEPYRGNPDFKIIRNQNNLGAAVSRNIGIAAARGRYIAFLDADDYWLPGKLKRQLFIMKKTGSAMSYTGRVCLTGGNQPCFKIIPPPRLNLRRLRRCNYLSCSSVVIRRDLIQQFPFDPDPDIHEDYECWLRILKSCGTIRGISDAYTVYHYRKGSKSSVKTKSWIMRIHTYEKAGFSYPMACVRSMVYYLFWFLQLRPERIHQYESSQRL